MLSIGSIAIVHHRNVFGNPLPEKLCCFRRISTQKWQFFCNYISENPNLHFSPLSGILGQTKTMKRKQEDEPMMLCTASKKENLTSGRFVSVFIDMISFGR